MQSRPQEFLSGYHGGDGSKVVVNIKTIQQQVRIRGTRCRTYTSIRSICKTDSTPRPVLDNLFILTYRSEISHVYKNNLG